MKAERLLLPSILLVMGFPLLALADECLECHRNETPAAVRQWTNSAHFDKVGCDDCHGNDHDQILSGESSVVAKNCGKCHENAFHQHINSRHGVSLHTGWGCSRNLPDRDPRECRFCHEEGSTKPRNSVQCARFLKQTSAMASIGCNRCHQVENSCAACHTNHLTNLDIVRHPGVCATCHMGPDHPQWEMWQTSRHGLLFESYGDETGPTCQRCHMPEGTHDVSIGITMSPGMQLFDKETQVEQRALMLGICQECHAAGFSQRELDKADAVHSQSMQLIAEAKEVIQDIADLNLLVPSLKERPAHPLHGQQLVLDGQMLYEDFSHIERLFFKMKKFDLSKTVKGAYHQNPAYTHWYGNAELKMTLVDIKAEADRLKRLLAIKSFSETDSGSQFGIAERRLLMLKRRFERGVISEQDYNHQRSEILENLNK
ncbi:MAG: hypothetical protein JRE16_07545 [Deltaproteobacteria bacterium]|jgi:hypothetical protein|nr:hypothetical protein [Deltaproteobacteria bacterium]